MFDIGFSELLLIAVVALVVLGPERLPKAARLAGLWARKARAQWNAVKAELENELADEELRRSLRETADAAREGAQQAHDLRESLRSDLALPAPRNTTLATAADPQAPPDATTQASSESSEPAPDLPATADVAPAPGDDDDPAQLSLLDPDPTLQMMALPPVSRRTSDD